MTTNKIRLAQGAGGLHTYKLINELFLKYFTNSILDQQLDAAIIPGFPGKWAFTTDSFVVQPLFFPGGNIGKLSVCGTINDLAVSGAKPLYLSCSFIIEEGFAVENLEIIVASMAETTKNAGVLIATGDTKVVEKGSCDGIFINTTGLGFLPAEKDYTPKHITSGDKIILTGIPGRHGLAILAARNKLEVSPPLVSDCACLHELLASLNHLDIHCMRDPTRGGLAITLNELALQSNLGFLIEETALPKDVRINSLAELLGLDPLYLANEGIAIIIISSQDASSAINVLQQHPLGQKATIIGEIFEENPGQVLLSTNLGTKRFLKMTAGNLLPRIC